MENGLGVNKLSPNLMALNWTTQLQKMESEMEVLVVILGLAVFILMFKSIEFFEKL